MSAATEQEAARLVIKRMQTAVLDMADAVRSTPLTPRDATHLEQLVELRLALIATVEAAIANGTPAGSALASLRDIGGLAWGSKLFVQYAGNVSMKTLGASVTAIACLMAEGAGVTAIENASSGTGDDVAVPHSTTRH